MCLGLGELVAVAIEMDELPACDLPIEAGEGAVYGMARSMPRYRCATFHVLKTPVSFIGLSSSRRITGFLEANMKIRPG